MTVPSEEVVVGEGWRTGFPGVIGEDTPVSGRVELGPEGVRSMCSVGGSYLIGVHKMGEYDTYLMRRREMYDDPTVAPS